MFIYFLDNKDALCNFVEHELRNIGIKQPSKLKKFSTKRASVHTKTRVFQRPLEHLPRQPVQLQCGAVVDVPCFLVDLCLALEQHLDTEGLFRKAGSAARQREIKAHIEAGGSLSSEFHEVDVANILKLFLRELPESLLPAQSHDILVRCQTLSGDHMLLACLLLPTSHLHSLAYVMEFLQRVASHSRLNLMPASNLAIMLTPALMPVPDHNPRAAPSKLTSHALQHDLHIQVLQALIESARHIGEIPAVVAEQLGLQPPEEEPKDSSFGSLDSLATERRGRKRRSGSLTRVLNGLRKMVGGRGSSPMEIGSQEQSTPGQMSPCIKSSKKRKVDTPAGGLSAKKKLEVLLSLPQGSVLASTPAKPSGTQPLYLLAGSPTPGNGLYATPPVCSHPNPQRSVTVNKSPQVLKNKPRNRFFTPKSRSESLLQRAVIGQADQKKPRLSFGSKKSSKKQQQKQQAAEATANPVTRQLLKRRKSWSSLGGSWGRSMRKLAPVVVVGTPLLSSPYATRPGGGSNEGLGGATARVDLSPQHPPVNLHSEYEEIKNKVSCLENQLNEELNKAQQACNTSNEAHIASFVQSAYERTLEDSEPFVNCQSTEQLAKRLSRELKIRRSGENKVIRSPSARKIGTIRRRSRESNRPLVRTSSLGKMVRSPVRSTVPLQHPRSLRRGRPNTVLSGLPQPSPATLHRSCFSSSQSLVCESPWKPVTQTDGNCKQVEFLVPQSPFTRPVTRASSFHGIIDSQIDCEDIKKTSSFGNIVDPFAGEEKWQSANEFLTSQTPSKRLPMVGRPSIAEIKRKRAGMVLASVRLFDSRNSTSPESKSGLRTSVTEQTKSPIVAKLKSSFKSQLNTTNSPKKIGSPRKRVSVKKVSPPKQEEKTPNSAISKSMVPAPYSDGIKHKRIGETQHSHLKVKVNSSLPGNWLSGKENLPSPANPFCLRSLKSQISPEIKLPDALKDTIYAVCTPRSQQLGVKSPLSLMDCNKMVTPQQCPVIKKPLSVRPIMASALRRTPHNLDTPLKSAQKPMQATPLRRSPRILAMSLSCTPHA